MMEKVTKSSEKQLVFVFPRSIYGLDIGNMKQNFVALWLPNTSNHSNWRSS